jgi:ATP-dependent exoDNAse (exonuclease V) beta subunit
MDCRQLKQVNSTNELKTIELNEAAIMIEECLSAFSRTDVTVQTRERLELLRQDLQGVRHSLKCLEEQDVVRSYRQLRERLLGNFGDAKLRSALVQAVLKLGALLVDYFLIEEEQAILRILNTFDDRFMQHKKSMGVLSYQDLLSLTKRSLNDDVDLRGRIKQGVSHILIDEYQDTNPIQEDIISFLAEGDDQELSLGQFTRVTIYGGR